MGMAVGGEKGGVQHDINVTPLIDVVLVLLIIFMVLTPMMQKAHQVNLPAPADPNDIVVNPPTPPSAQLIITIDKDKAIFMNQDAADLTDIESKVKEVLANRKDKLVFFKCDPGVAYSYAMAVMDRCRGAGAEKIGIITEELKKEAEEAPPAEAPAPPA